MVPSRDTPCRRHPHRNQEIFTYVIDGQLTHADSMGNKEALGRGVNRSSLTSSGRGNMTVGHLLLSCGYCCHVVGKLATCGFNSMHQYHAVHVLSRLFDIQ